jgi:two-component system chemotaxis response regulator CheY
MSNEKLLSDAEETPTKERTIMVVDDAATFRTIARRMLHSLGYYRIVDCSSAEDALQKLEEEKVDVIISDWTMPGMSGLDFFTKLRADERFKELPFLVVTGNSDRRTILTASKAGIPSYIVKPLSAEFLGKKLQDIFSGRTSDSEPRPREE